MADFSPSKLAVWVLIGGLMLNACGTFYIGYRLTSGESDLAKATVLTNNMMHSCIHYVLDTVNEPHPQLAMYKDTWDLCGNEIYNVDYLADFDIRRDKLIWQNFDERVLLWMVVIVSLSGVVLAGLQLNWSYKLASLYRTELAHDSQLSIEAGKMSIRSSVTGVLILALSLAFFFIYVKWIYTLQEVKAEKPEHSQVSAGVISGYGQVLESPGDKGGVPGAVPRPPATPEGPASGKSAEDDNRQRSGRDEPIGNPSVTK